MFKLGILYRTQQFLELISQHPMTAGEFRRSFPRFEQVSSADIIHLATSCFWCRDGEGSQPMQITVGGQEILSCSTAGLRLRIQLRDIMRYRPPTWIGLLQRGRDALSSYGELDIIQCFHIAGLLQGNDLETARWWDEIASPLREAEAARRLALGRQAERMSLEYEERRVGQTPEWTALENSVAGYDLLSRVDRESAASLTIEVKASELPAESAAFYLSRHEWEVLRGCMRRVSQVPADVPSS